MPLAAGELLGPYKIGELIGKGGMGEVYKAVDTRLNRDVAVKVSAARFNDRFEREARAVAALNHANICTLYDVGASPAGFGFLVMEFVEGATLADLVKKGPIAYEEAWRLAQQIIAGLEAAHEKGIVHRDLKPANIKIRPDGTVKVLDFGLAKVASASRPEEHGENSPTLTMGMTEAGMILGTAAYMAPEQARGTEVDKRADIWAFGVVLYEMLTGERLFGAATVSDTLAQVLVKEPGLDRVPKKVQPLLRSCLEKEPRRRLRDIGDAWRLLEEPQEPAIVGTAPSRSRLGWRGNAGPWIAAVVCAVAALAGGVVAYRHVSEQPPAAIKFFVPPPDKGAFNLLNSYTVAVSPDGTRVAFLATVEGKDQIWLRDLGSASLRMLPGTEGAVGAPFWSPDSRFIGFFAGGKVKKMEVAGGPAITLCDAPNGRNGAWSKNDVMVFQMDAAGPLLRAPAVGGSATTATELDVASREVSHRFPSFLPDGRHFLYTDYISVEGQTTVYVGDLESKDRRRVFAGATNAVYVPGYLLFVRERTLMAQAFDIGKLAVTGEATPVAEQVTYDAGNARGQFSASQNGVIAYIVGGNAGEAQLTWFDRSGKTLGTVGRPGLLTSAAISPDGSLVAFDRQDPQSGVMDLWLDDLRRDTESRFTFGARNSLLPVWSPDGGTIGFLTFGGDGRRNGQAFRKAVNGVGREEALDGVSGAPDDWSRDGRYLIWETSALTPKTGRDIWVQPLTPDKAGDRKPFPYVETNFNERFAKLSPDGRWLAYQSDESKQYETYVQTFPSQGGKWQVSTNGGQHPVWSRDGRELFFLDLSGKMMAVEVPTSGEKFDPGAPKALFDTRMAGNGYDVSKDGRFLIPTLVGAGANQSMMVVVNWTAGLKK